MWLSAAPKIASGDVQIDPLLKANNDSRRGISLLARLNEPLQQQLDSVIKSLQQLAPRQYYYPRSDRHITLLSIISCEPNLQLKDIDSTAYIAMVKPCLADFSHLTIDFKGVGVSPAALLLQGFPQTDSLEILRDRLRHRFKASSLRHSIDARYSINTAHCTFMRFQQPLENPAALIHYLQQQRETNFASLQITELELVFNDWYQRQARCKTLHQFALGTNVP